MTRLTRLWLKNFQNMPIFLKLKLRTKNKKKIKIAQIEKNLADLH